MASVAYARGAQLAALHATLVALRSHAAEATVKHPAPVAELDAAKHQLRDWIEAQLDSLKDLDTNAAFEHRVNEALKPVSVTVGNDEQNLLGTLGQVRLGSESGVLTVITAVGIFCQYDMSAYAYQLVNGHWKRVWESEQDAAKDYAPQHLIAVHVLQPFHEGGESGPIYVMTLGNEWGCASNWHSVYYRVWRVDASRTKLLIDGSGFAWLRTDLYAVGRIAQDGSDAPVDVLVEFTESSVDAGVHAREAVGHFLIEGDKVRRVDPVALSPRDFVDEWLTQGWKASADWSGSPALESWHRRLHRDDVFGDFIRPTTHCETPDLWQVGFEPQDAERDFAPESDVYFLVRWRPPYHFTIFDINSEPWPDCTQEDPEADEWRTLFPIQGWR